MNGISEIVDLNVDEHMQQNLSETQEEYEDKGNIINSGCNGTSVKELGNDEYSTIDLLSNNVSAMKDSSTLEGINCQVQESELKFNDKSTKELELEACVISQQKQLEEKLDTISELEQKCTGLSQKCLDLETKLKTANRQCEIAIKDKEAMVMRYAVGEKAVLDQKAAKEQKERKLQDALKEIELLQHKLQSMGAEKARICQMLDNKCYEVKTSQQEFDKLKFDLNSLETKLKWSQNSLRTEIELHKESVAKCEELSTKIQTANEQMEQAKKEAQESIRNFRQSQENRAYVLDQQVKELQANLILERHERDDRDNQIRNLQSELERLQSKQKVMLQENNTLSVKVQLLEEGRLENEQKLSELRGCADQQKQNVADLNAKVGQVEQLKLQLANVEEQLEASKNQGVLLKERNVELEGDMESCRIREAELLLFTQQLTDKNVRLQSEFTAMETKVQQLQCEQTLLKRVAKEHETKSDLLTKQLADERSGRAEESQLLARHLAEKTRLCELYSQELADQKGENSVIKRKLELSLREVNRELQQCRKRLEQHETTSAETTSRSSSSTSLNTVETAAPSAAQVIQQDIQQVEVIQPEQVLDKQALIEHIVKLQRASARKSEKIDFLEEHVSTLVSELQRKTRLLQSYIVREQTGALSSNTMDDNKAELAKTHGVMASLYSSRNADDGLTLELSMEINRKLQAVLEDALLKNITLKGNVDTLGSEIDRLNKLLKHFSAQS